MNIPQFFGYVGTFLHRIITIFTSSVRWSLLLPEDGDFFQKLDYTHYEANAYFFVFFVCVFLYLHVYLFPYSAYFKIT